MQSSMRGHWYIAKTKRGPRTEPWGTPDIMLVDSLLMLSSTTCWVMFVKKSLIQSNSVPWIP